MSCASSTTLSDPAACSPQVKSSYPHEYVVPSNFATIPTNNIQKRMMKNVYYNYQQQPLYYNNSNRRPSSIGGGRPRSRFSLPPSIKEEEEDEENQDNIILDTPTTHQKQRRHHSLSVITTTTSMMMDSKHDDDDKQKEEEDMIPLAMLAYRKGFVVPDKPENVFPLVQHIPSPGYQQPFISQQQGYFQQYNRIDPRYNKKRLTPLPVISNDHIAHLANKYNKRLQQQLATKEKPLLRTPFYQLQQNHSYSSSLSSNSSSSSSSASSLVSTPPSSPRPNSTTSSTRKPFYRHPSAHI